MASWYVFMGVLLLVAGITLRHVREIPLVHATVAGWSALLLLLIPFHWSSFRAGTSLTVWIVFHRLLLIFSGTAARKAWAQMRRTSQDF
jgi:hypothetical protein